MDKENAKAVLRRGQAFLAKGELEKAESDLKYAKLTYPDDKGIDSQFKILQAKQKEAALKVYFLFLFSVFFIYYYFFLSSVQERAMYKNMFENNTIKKTN